MKQDLEKEYLTNKGVQHNWTNDELFDKFVAKEFTDEHSDVASSRALPSLRPKPTKLQRVNSDAGSQVMVYPEDVNDELRAFGGEKDSTYKVSADDIVDENPEKSTQFAKVPESNGTNDSKIRRALRHNSDVAKLILNPKYDPKSNKGYTGPNYRNKGFASRLNQLAKELQTPTDKIAKGKETYKNQKILLQSLSTKCVVLQKALRLRGVDKLSVGEIDESLYNQDNGIDLNDYKEKDITDVLDKILKVFAVINNATFQLSDIVADIKEIKNVVKEMLDLLDDDGNLVYPHLPDWQTMNPMPIYVALIASLSDMVALEHQDAKKVKEYEEKTAFNEILHNHIEAFQEFEEKEADGDDLEYEETPPAKKRRK